MGTEENCNPEFSLPWVPRNPSNLKEVDTTHQHKRERHRSDNQKLVNPSQKSRILPLRFLMVPLKSKIRK